MDTIHGFTEEELEKKAWFRTWRAFKPWLQGFGYLVAFGFAFGSISIIFDRVGDGIAAGFVGMLIAFFTGFITEYIEERMVYVFKGVKEKGF